MLQPLYLKEEVILCKALIVLHVISPGVTVGVLDE